MRLLSLLAAAALVAACAPSPIPGIPAGPEPVIEGVRFETGGWEHDLPSREHGAAREYHRAVREPSSPFSRVEYRMDPMRRPDPSEYSLYYRRYVDTVPDEDLAGFLARQVSHIETRSALVPADRESYRYEPGKWSIREVVGHISDTERVFAYRLLHFARQDPSVLPGMDQDHFMAQSRFGERTLASITQEFVSVRAATLSLVASLTPEDADRVGVASGFPFSVRALAWIIAGHAQHHLNVLAERYHA